MYQGLAKSILAKESSSARFEELCCALLTKELGTTVIQTAASWDKGRDGGTIDGGTFVSSTLEKKLDAKIDDDAVKLSSLPETASLYYCSVLPLSEHLRDLKVKRIKQLTTLVKVQFLGAHQIAELCVQHEEIFRRLYAAEIDQVVDTIRDTDHQDARTAALRLALMTVGQVHSDAIREGAYEALILGAVDEAPQSPGQLSSGLASTFHLGRSLPADVVYGQVERLQGLKMLATTDEGKIALTDAGRQRLRALREQEAAAVVTGREEIRIQLEADLSIDFGDQQFERLWDALLDAYAHALRQEGERYLKFASDLVSGGSKDDDTDEPYGEALVDRLATAASDAVSKLDRQQDEVYHAVYSIFLRGEGPAYEWLIDTCMSYLIVCSLGLEQGVAEAMRNLVKNMRLVLDTDIALRLLGDAEPEHEAVKSIVRRVPQFGGEVFYADPVVEEVARHAWIAQRDYNECKQHFDVTDRFSDYSSNVFVRAFRRLWLRNRRRGSFGEFIQNFRGRSEYDSRVVIRILREDFGLKPLEIPSGSTIYDDAKGNVAPLLQATLRERGEAGQKIAEDKAERDARLYAGCVASRASVDQATGFDHTYLVTSSRRLHGVDDQYAGQLAEKQLVLSMSQLIYILAIVPGLQLTHSALRAIMFDDSLRPKLRPIEKTISRALAASREFDLPFAKRGMLLRRVGDKIHARARARGQSQRELEAELDDPANADQLADLVGQALDDVNVPPKTIAENEELKQRVADLEYVIRKAGVDERDF